MQHIVDLIRAAIRRAEHLPDETVVDEHAPMSREAFTYFRKTFMRRAKLMPKNGHLEWMLRYTTPHVLAKQLMKAA